MGVPDQAPNIDIKSGGGKLTYDKERQTIVCENTDREIWRGPDEGLGSYYADSIHVTKAGGIGINCGGHVIVKSPRAWHGLAKKPQRYDIATDELVEVTQEWVDSVQTMFNKFGAARGHARSFLKRGHARSFLKSPDANPEGTRKAIQAFMDAWKPEFEQKPPA